MLFLFFIIIIGISARFDCPNPNSPYLPISLPTHWINGSINCLAKGAQQPDLDIFSVNNDTFILRENKCINYEAPFMYLLFGNHTVLLIDSGATVSSNSFPIQQHVENLIFHWCIKKKKQRQDMKLIISHTHNHRDHTAGDEQFQNKPFTTIIGTSVDEIIRYFQFNNWPNSISIYALDNQRHLAIIPIPGHEKSSIAFFDCATGLLLTGDSLYPGRLYISNFSANVESISRLRNFIQTNHLNITAILGTHIEMTQKHQVDYPIGATYQPKERELNMSLEQLEQLHNELQYQWNNGFNQRHRAYYDTFILDPNPSELPLFPSNKRISKHRFLLMPLDRLDYVWISYQPMFHTSIDFQLVFLASITNSTIDSLVLSSTNITKLNEQRTIESYELSLNNLINGNISSFPAKLYQGDSEKYLGDITINFIQPFLSIIQLNLSEIEPYQPLRYISYLLSNSIKSQIHLYLLHQIRVQPDFDAIVHVMINPLNCTTDIERNQLNNLLEENGNEWAFPGFDNNIYNRLTSISGPVRGQLLGDVYSTVCTMQIIEEIQCRFFSHYQSQSNESYQRNFHYQLNGCQQIKMINHDEEKFFHGFMPVWALTLFSIAIIFIVIFILGLICHLAGCRRPREDATNNIHSSIVEQPLLVENNQPQTNSIRSNELSQKSKDLFILSSGINIDWYLIILIRYLTTFCLFFTVIFSAPIPNTYGEEPSEPTTNTSIRLTYNDDPSNISSSNLYGQPVPLPESDQQRILLPNSYQKSINYETRSGGFEGDMIFPNGFNPSEPQRERGVAMAGPHRWPNNVIPYDISAITSSADEDFIVNAIQTLMYAVGTLVEGETSRQACVYFRPKLPDEQNSVKITYGDGCSGTVGYWPDNGMTLTLANPGCFISGIIQHELMHILGFYHEQSRPDRDSYITVNYENIESDETYNFNKYAWRNDVLNQNSPYDYGSIMHYSAYEFSSNGQPTISPTNTDASIGQRRRLSDIDIAEIRAYYSC